MKSIVLIRVLLLWTIALPLSTSNTDGQDDTSKTPAYWRAKLKNFSATSDEYYISNAGRGMKFGILSYLQLNRHMADFRELGEQYPSCCPENFGATSSTGFEPGLFFDLPLSKHFLLSLGAGYQDYSAELNKTEKFPYSYSNERKEGEIEHNIDVKLSSVTFRPRLVYNQFGRFNIVAGGEAGIVLSKEFEQNEKLNVDDPFTFSTKSDLRNIKSGELQEANTIMAGLNAAISYDIPLDRNGRLSLTPELGISYYFTSITKNLVWNYNSLKLGIALKYSPRPTIDTIPMEIKKQRRFEDSLRIITSLFEAMKDSTMEALASLKKMVDENVIIADITEINYVDSAGFEYPIEHLRIEQSKHTRSVPLLNYVFFEKGSSNIPERYNHIRSSNRYNFDEGSLINKQILEIYYDILNIIGKRMYDNPDATITLEGCNDNTGVERGDTLLSFRRAEQISYYLQNVWKIPARNIKIKARNLPEKFTGSIDPRGNEENRRVEIYSDNYEIMKPLIAEEEIFSYAIPQKLRTYLNITAGSGITDWYIKVEDYYGMEKKLLMENFDTIPRIINWNFNNKNIIPKDSGEIYFTLYAEDAKGTSMVDLETIPVDFVGIEEKRRRGIRDTVYEVYNILLPFEDPGLDEFAEKTASYIKTRIEKNKLKNPQIHITGYTDILGKKATNNQLAKARVQKLVNYLNVDGIESSYESPSSKFDNSVPEGRFYNRSVEVRLKYLSEL